jgi:hypothetical protein
VTNLYGDDCDGRRDRAKVDHDRDDVWNKSWTLKATLSSARSTPPVRSSCSQLLSLGVLDRR